MKTCPSCGEEIIGRIDKKFCSSYCKSSYHYLKNRDKPENRFKKIDNQLKLNRRVLKEYNKGGKVTVRKSILLQEGFDPKYFTHYWKNNKGDVYLFCYEYGFLSRSEHGIVKYVLVQHQPYMN
ncbi:MAG: hypothetical protein AAGA02_12600 [Bacteroidota bacterium]